MKIQRHLILLSGGVGSRFGANYPKQYFISSDGETILYKSIKNFKDFNFKSIVIVCDSSYRKIIESEISKLNWDIKTIFSNNGATRQESFDNGVEKIKSQFTIDENTFVFTQEAVRPNITSSIISDIVEADASYMTVSAGINPMVMYGVYDKESRQSKKMLPKDSLIELQLPKRHNLKKYIELRNKFKLDPVDIMDESQIFVDNGISVFITLGSHQNVKITHPENILRIINNSDE